MKRDERTGDLVGLKSVALTVVCWWVDGLAVLLRALDGRFELDADGEEPNNAVSVGAVVALRSVVVTVSTVVARGVFSGGRD